MAKSKQDTKSADKASGAKGGKGKSKGDEAKDTKSSKGAQSINVRHILVGASISYLLYTSYTLSYRGFQSSHIFTV